MFCLILGDGNFLAFAGIRHFDGPQGHSRDSSNFGETIFVYMYLRTASCRRPALQLQLRPGFYPDSVCPELAQRHIV